MTLEYRFMLQLTRLLAQQHPSQAYPGPLDEDKLLRSAIYHQIVPLIDYYRPALQTIFPDLTPAFFQKVHDYTIANQYYIIKVEKLLNELTNAFDAAHVEYRVFKGVVLAREVYSQPYLRTFGDIDLLIKPEDLPRVEKLLFELKFAPCSDLYNVYPIEIAQKYHFARHYQHTLPPEIPVDIHLGITGELFPFQFSFEDFWKHTQPITINGKTHLTFDMPHQAVLALFHAFKHYYFKLIWFADLYLLCQKIDLAPSDLTELFAKYNLQRIWWFYRYLAQTFFNQEPSRKFHLTALERKIIAPRFVINGFLPYSESFARYYLPLVYLGRGFVTGGNLYRQLLPPRELISDFYGPNPLPMTWRNYWRLRFRALKNLFKT